MTGIELAQEKVKKGLHKGKCIGIRHDPCSSDENFEPLEVSRLETGMTVEIEGTGVDFEQHAYGSDLDIAKNILPGDRVELHLLDDHCAIWLKEGETFDEEKHVLDRFAASNPKKIIR